MAARHAVFLLLLCCFSRLSLAQIETPSTPAVAEEDATPVRLAYFSFVEGEVEWRLDPDASASTLEGGEALSQNYDWAKATVNLPLRAGMEVRVPQNSKAEICFDDGSLVRLGGNSVLALETMTAEEGSEFTGLRLEGGLVTLKLKNAASLFQLQSGSTSLRARGPASVRVDGKTDGNEIAVRAGRAFIENETGTLTLRAGQFLKTSLHDEQFAPGRLPAADSWEQWNLTRDDFLENDSLAGAQNLPQNISLVAGNLEQYGDWRDDAAHGRVWYPRVSQSDWRPYSIGQWSWVFPFGWTWISGEPWGWAPYHYGSWICNNFGWGWVPGPAWQPWCPGVVSFFERNGERCWAPLSPWEVRYPNYPRRVWHRSFSIIYTAVYFPGSGSYCEPRAWDASYINYVPNITYINYIIVIRRKKKIEYYCPDKSGHGKRKRVRVDGAPDETFEEVFGQPHRDWNDRQQPELAALPETKSSLETKGSLGKSTPSTPVADLRGLFKGFVPRFARRNDQMQNQTQNQTNRDGATAISLQNLELPSILKKPAPTRDDKSTPAAASSPLRREAPSSAWKERNANSQNQAANHKPDGGKPADKNAIAPSVSTLIGNIVKPPVPATDHSKTENPRGEKQPETSQPRQNNSQKTESSNTEQSKIEQERKVEREVKERARQEQNAREQAAQQERLQKEQQRREREAQERANREREAQEREARRRAQQAKEQAEREARKRQQPSPPTITTPGNWSSRRRERRERSDR